MFIKNCLGVALLLGSLMIFAPVHAFELKSSVMKVQVYSKNDYTKKYTNIAYGSALYVGKNRVLTNAHVILDDRNKVAPGIELCGVTDPMKRPSCFSAAKVLRYDEDIDLALLESQESIQGNPVKLANKNPQTDDVVIIKGFPNNGLDTITTTRGFVGGNYQDYLKLDADLDGGNSGGGGFNKEYELIGIPTFYVEGGENLGYIIPIEKIKQFLDKKGVITDGSKNSFDVTFSDYLSSINKVLNSGIVKNSYIVTKKIIGFDIINYAIGANNTYYILYKSSKSDAMISIDISNMTDTTWSSVFSKSIQKQLTVLGEGVKTQEFTTNFGGLTWNGISYSDEDNAMEGRTLYAIASGNKMLQINIIGSKKEASSAIAKKLMTKISIKPYQYTSFLGRFGFLDFVNKYGNVSQDVKGVYFDPAFEHLMESEYTFRSIASSSEYSKLITSLEKIAKVSGEKIIAVKNAKGNVFHVIYSQSDDASYPSKMIVMFLTKSDGKFYINGINFQFLENAELKKTLIYYLDNLTIFDSEPIIYDSTHTVDEILK